MSIRVSTLTFVGICLLAVAAVSAGHHGTSTYDMEKEIQLIGTVKEWTFENPHSWLWLRTAVPQKTTEEWSIESAPPSYLSQRGWSASTLKTGESVTVLVSPLKVEPRRAILLEVKRASGEVLIVRPRGSFGRPAAIK